MIADDTCTHNERYDHFRCITCQNCEAVCPEKAIKIEGDYRVKRGYWKNDHLYSGGKTHPALLEDKNGEPKKAPLENRVTETEQIISRPPRETTSHGNLSSFRTKLLSMR